MISLVAKIVRRICCITLTSSLLFFGARAQQPAISSFSPAGGAPGTLVAINGSNLDKCTALRIGGVPAIRISATADHLVAMLMPGAVTGNISLVSANGVTNTVSRFTVQATPLPSVIASGKLNPSTASTVANIGYSVAVSADGNTAIAGGFKDNGFKGGAWIYTRSGGTWSTEGYKLPVTDAIGEAQVGISVALSADGNTALVGGYYDDGLKGAAWVFVRDGDNWVQQGPKLRASGAAGASGFGYAAALSADGNTAALGGYLDNANVGAAWIFSRTGATWAQQGTKLVGSGAIGASQQGRSIALSADGNTLAVGGFHDNYTKGAVWIYIRNNGSWLQQGPKLVGTGSSEDSRQGFSVALSADGNITLIGGYYDHASQGAAWVFKRGGTNWTQQGERLVGRGGGASAQGSSVTLSADGTIAAIGGYLDNYQNGAIWLFNRKGDDWTQTGDKLLAGDNVGSAGIGISSALSADASTLIAGGFQDNAGRGAAWQFRFPAAQVAGTVQEPVIDKKPLSAVADLSGLSLGDLALSPSFAPDVFSYTATAANSLSALSITAKLADTTAKMSLNGKAFDGVGKLPLVVGKNLIILTITAQDGSRKTYTLVVSREASGVNDLAGLVISAGKLSPAFSPAVTNYTAAVDNTTTAIVLSTAAADSTAVIRVNGNLYTGKDKLALSVGKNTISITITAQNGSVKNYTLVVSRDASGVNDLAGLAISAGNLSPAFAPAVTNYLVNVDHYTTSFLLTPRLADTTATMLVNGNAISNGGAAQVALPVGITEIPVAITAQNGTVLTYHVTVNRAKSSESSLGALQLDSVALIPAFSPAIHDYRAEAVHSLSKLGVKISAADAATQQITVNGSTVTAAGTYYTPLSDGRNEVVIGVVAEDGTRADYTLVVTREPAPLPAFAAEPTPAAEHPVAATEQPVQPVAPAPLAPQIAPVVPNGAPTLAEIPAQSLCWSSAGKSIALEDLSAGPEKGQRITVRASASNPRILTDLSISDNGVLTFRPGSADGGTTQVTVTVKDDGGIENGGIDSVQRTFQVTVAPMPQLTVTANRETVYAGDAVTLSANQTSCVWLTDSGSIAGQKDGRVTLHPDHTTTYTAVATNETGCSVQQQLTVYVNAQPRVLPPTAPATPERSRNATEPTPVTFASTTGTAERTNNILTPNGDGRNDVLVIGGLGDGPNTIKIYNRAGREVYRAQNYANDWNGTGAGGDLPEDTYYYVVDRGLKLPPVKGFVSLIR